MKYYKGMRYVTAEYFSHQTNIIGYSATLGPITLLPSGLLGIDRFYPWDGNSGPCVDWRSTLKASCVHDALCDLVNAGLLPQSLQPMIDQEYYDICKNSGLWEWVARIRLILVRWYQTGKRGLHQRKVYVA
jgi:hypothetical protein